jgi:hypothetical protein
VTAEWDEQGLLAVYVAQHEAELTWARYYALRDAMVAIRAYPEAYGKLGDRLVQLHQESRDASVRFGMAHRDLLESIIAGGTLKGLGDRMGQPQEPEEGSGD